MSRQGDEVHSRIQTLQILLKESKPDVIIMDLTANGEELFRTLQVFLQATNYH